MYTPAMFQELREEVLLDLIKQYPLAALVVYHDEIVVNHLPLVFERPHKQGVLKGHVPVSNPLCNALVNSCEAVAVFQGPQAYISPSWYPSKQAHGKVVPTWDYAVVHVHGSASAVHDGDWLIAHLNRLTDQQEGSQPQPWQVADAPVSYTNTLVERLVGIEVTIDSMVGKWKVSQNKSAEDKAGVAEGLESQGTEEARRMARLVSPR